MDFLKSQIYFRVLANEGKAVVEVYIVPGFRCQCLLACSVLCCKKLGHVEDLCLSANSSTGIRRDRRHFNSSVAANDCRSCVNLHMVE